MPSAPASLRQEPCRVSPRSSTPEIRGFQQFPTMKLDEIIGDIEATQSLAELKHVLQRIAEYYGSAAFNFLDTGHPHLDVPFYFGTSGEAWEHEYLRNNFVHVD